MINNNVYNIDTYILAVRKLGHLNRIAKMSDFEARLLIGSLARVFASQTIGTLASKSNIFCFYDKMA